MHHILSHFGLELRQERHDILIPGSPERCITRSVFEDTSGRLWLLERLSPEQLSRRETIGRLVSDLARHGAPHTHPFNQADSAGYVLRTAEDLWQCSPFISGKELPRPEYIDDAWRGRAIGDFIAGIQKAGAMLPDIPDAGTPPLPDYITTLATTLGQREPQIHERISSVIRQCTPFFTALNTLPVAVAHGDCHPLNIIWGDSAILGVIDWEFSGCKPTIYDAANCIGCVGFEHPDWLVRGLVPALVRTLHGHDILNEMTMPWLLPCTCALRFAWLSEWLRRDDREMIDMELDYMDILVRHGNIIQQRWQEACQ